MNRKTLALFAFVVFLSGMMCSSLPAQSRQDRNRAKNLQDEGDQAVRQKKYKLAIEKYSQALTLVADNPYAHFWRGTANYYLWQDGVKALAAIETQRKAETNETKQKEIDAQIDAQKKENQTIADNALNELTVALSQGFRPLEVHRLRGFIFYEQKNYDTALDEVRKALVIAPKDLQLQKGLGEIQLARNAPAEALVALREAAKTAPNDADIQYNMARAHFHLRDAKAQQAAAEAALAKGTRFPGEAFYLLGDAHRKQRNAAGAIDAFQKALNVKPDIYQAYRDLADVYRNENRFNDAIEISRKGLLIFRLDGNIYTDLSWFYSLADRPEDAVAAAKAGIQMLPTQYVAYTNLCRAYNETKQYDLAIQACNQALRIKPGDGETYFYLGRALNLTDKTTEATRYYGLAVKGLEEYTRTNPDFSDGWYLLGNAYFADNQREKAIDAFLKCLELAPKFAKARYNLGIVYTRRNNKPGAQEQYAKLSSLDPKLAQALKTEIDKM